MPINTPNDGHLKEGFTAIKTLKGETLKAMYDMQQVVADTKNKIDTLNRLITQKQKQFVEISKANKIDASSEESVAPRETLDTPKQSGADDTKIILEVKAESSVKSTREENSDTVKSEPIIVEKSSKSENISNSTKPIRTDKVDKQPQTSQVQKKVDNKQTFGNATVVVEKSDGKTIQKTYTDDKGNVKVRRFLDLTVTQRPTTPKPAQNNRPYAQGNNSYPRNNNGTTGTGSYQQGSRPPYQQRPYNNNANGTSTYNRPPMGGARPNFADKDADTSAQHFGAKPPIKKPAPFGIATPFNKDQKSFGNKNKTHEKTEDTRFETKKSLLTKTFGDYGEDDEFVSARKRRAKKANIKVELLIKKTDHAIISGEEIQIKSLSEKIGVSVSEIIKTLFKENIIKTINDSLDYTTAEYVSGLFNVTLEQKIDKTAEDIVVNLSTEDDLPDTEKRPPIVTVMGHVDHGKTSILDAIRKTNVTSSEAGGITQHIGAYTVKIKGQQITFIDTPGHAAFTAMRARGAKVTDVAVIVVAADDGVMPQTIEAINHAKAAEVSIVVAINKMDKPSADPDRVKQQLTEYNLVPEEWGGDTIMVPVSAKSGAGIDKLLESIILVTDIKELKANPDKKATGTIIESKVDKGRGPVATVLVANGTLKVGDSFIAGLATGKVRALFDDKGRTVKSAGPACPVEILGFDDLPDAGDLLFVADEKLVRQVSEERKTKIKIENTKVTSNVNLENINSIIAEGEMKVLNLIVKTDVQGSLAALKDSLIKISNDEVKIVSIHGGVGAINETDVMLAKASNAIIIGFNVRADAATKAIAEKEGVDIRIYSVIYDAVDDVTLAVKGMLAPKFKETILGTISVRDVFKITGVGVVAGCYVTNGKAQKGASIRIYRNDTMIRESKIVELKRFKDTVKEVASGFECGISIDNYTDIKVDDVFEAFVLEQIEQ